MEPIVTDAAWLQYVEKHQGVKGYCHFDRKDLHLGVPEVQEYVCNPKMVAKHSFYPFIQYYIVQNKASKKEGQLAIKAKERLISYSSHMDNCIFQRYAFLINAYYNRFSKDAGLDGVSIAYRDNLHKVSYQLANEAFKFIKKHKRCFVMVGDFSNFFDNIEHRYLKRMLCKLLEVKELPADYYAVFKNITKYGKCWLTDILEMQKIIKASFESAKKELEENYYTALSKEQFKAFQSKITKNKDNIGIPQGSPLSAVLANVYMLECDLQMNQFVKEHNGMYMRYSDDTIVIIPIEDEYEIEEYKAKVMSIWSQYEGLVELKEEKTKQCYYHKGVIEAKNDEAKCFIDYLGLRLTKEGVRVKPKCISKYYSRMKHKVRTIKRQRLKREKVGTANLYKYYGGLRGERSLISFLERVDRIVGLENDPEAQALLHGGAKRKIRKEMRKE